jgi:uncharacterized membrane protein
MNRKLNMNTSKTRKSVRHIQDLDELVSTRQSLDINQLHEERLSLGERIADHMADIAGSWTFIISFLLILFAWIIINSIQLVRHTFDPFPFILLNLVLSCLAAIQAPVIMMSQNRQEKKDRLRSEQDFETNLKSEIIIEDIYKKLKKMDESHKVMAEKQEKVIQLLSEINLKK